MIPTGRPCSPRDNPFASRRVDRLGYRLADVDWTGLEARLARLGWRGAIVGPKGSGKTALIETLAERLGPSSLSLRIGDARDRPLRRLGRELARSTARDRVVLLDSAGRLSTTAWWVVRGLLRTARGLIITAHRPGRLPTAYLCRTSPALLRELVSELAPDAAVDDLDGLFERHAGNIRDCFRELYDRYAGRL